MSCKLEMLLGFDNVCFLSHSTSVFINFSSAKTDAIQRHTMPCLTPLKHPNSCLLFKPETLQKTKHPEHQISKLHPHLFGPPIYIFPPIQSWPSKDYDDFLATNCSRRKKRVNLRYLRLGRFFVWPPWKAQTRDLIATNLNWIRFGVWVKKKEFWGLIVFRFTRG